MFMRQIQRVRKLATSEVKPILKTKFERAVPSFSRWKSLSHSEHRSASCLSQLDPPTARPLLQVQSICMSLQTSDVSDSSFYAHYLLYTEWARIGPSQICDGYSHIHMIT